MNENPSRGRQAGGPGHKALKQLSISLSASGIDKNRTMNAEVNGNDGLISLRRVTLYPYHPRSKEALSPAGYLIRLPKSLEELLAIAGMCKQHLTKVEEEVGEEEALDITSTGRMLHVCNSAIVVSY